MSKKPSSVSTHRWKVSVSSGQIHVVLQIIDSALPDFSVFVHFVLPDMVIIKKTIAKSEKYAIISPQIGEIVEIHKWRDRCWTDGKNI
jgi:hypothetical protein